MPPKLEMPTNIFMQACWHKWDANEHASMNLMTGLLAYHVLHADAAHGAGLDALKSGIKLVALLLDHSPSLRNGHPPTRAHNLVRRKLLAHMKLPVDTNPKS